MARLAAYRCVNRCIWRTMVPLGQQLRHDQLGEVGWLVAPIGDEVAYRRAKSLGTKA